VGKFEEFLASDCRVVWFSNIVSHQR